MIRERHGEGLSSLRSQNDGFGDGTRGLPRVSYAPLPDSQRRWRGGALKGEDIRRKRTTWGELSLCSDARSSEKPRTNEGN